MTVKELILKLSEFDPEYKIVVQTNCLGGFEDVTTVFDTVVTSLGSEEDISVVALVVG
mgnify:CR=1 FL=1